LLGIFAIGAPGVPGGTVMASLGLIVSVLGFDAAGTALMLTIFALQDSFGTACNVTSDGALTLMISEYSNRITKRQLINRKLPAKNKIFWNVRAQETREQDIHTTI
jgi:Na+/H+-dicarboxylate symporter